MSSRKRSAVWNHFSESEPKKAKCSYCSTILCVNAGNTGNLTRHMKSKHPTIALISLRQEPAPVPQETQGAIPTTSSQTEPLEHSRGTAFTFRGAAGVPHGAAQTTMTQFVQNTKPLPPRRAEVIDQQLVKMIACGYHPFSIVEEPEFKKFVTMLCPGYNLPTRKTVSESLLQKMYQQEKEKAKTKIDAAPAICLTTDGWTSTHNSESFIGVTAHYIDKNESETKLGSTMLGCIKYSERHTAENLTRFLKNIMEEWNISHKITAVASDNAHNITAAISGGNWRQIPCFAHSLNLCVQTALGAIADTLEKIKTLVTYFKRSTQAAEKLKEMQRQLNCPQLKLKIDVVTRWNSVYDMLHRVLQVKDAITSTLAMLRPDLLPGNDDWRLIEAALPILKIFYDVTQEISGEKNVTLSKIIPICHMLHLNIRRFMSEGSSISQIQLMLDTLKEELENRFRYTQHTVLNAEATLLDPRFKEKGFREKSLADRATAALKLKIGHTNAPRPLNTVEPPPPTSTTSSLWEHFDREVAKQTPANPTAAGIVEFEKYMQEPILPRTSDPLKWWHERRHIYPMLYDYIQRRLGLVATSVPCERLFSKAGNILRERRTRLSAKKLNELLFISSNMA